MALISRQRKHLSGLRYFLAPPAAVATSFPPASKILCKWSSIVRHRYHTGNRVTELLRLCDQPQIVTTSVRENSYDFPDPAHLRSFLLTTAGGGKQEVGIRFQWPIR